MRYLFFDLEFANCINGIPRACEFGYLVTDEKFKVFEKGNFLINPKIKRQTWDKYAVKKILTRTVSEYEKADSFEVYYPLIKRLFAKADYVIGHSLELDIASLSGECRRYGLDQIEFNCCDNKFLYKQYNSLKEEPSLKTILANFKIEPCGNHHDALDDACDTMLGLKAMLKAWNLSLEELIIKCPSGYYHSSKYDVYKALNRLKTKRKKQEAAKRRKSSRLKQDKKLDK